MAVASAVKTKPETVKRSSGRPTLYSDEIGDKICARLENKESLNAICKDDDMPHESTVRSWSIDPNHPIYTKYARAREIGYLKLADELIEISDQNTSDDSIKVQRDRLRVDTRKWMLSKMLPKVFGDKITNEIANKDGETFEIKDSNADARRVAFMLGRAVGRNERQKAENDS